MFALKRPLRDDAELWGYEWQNEAILRALLASREADDYAQQLLDAEPVGPEAAAADAVSAYFGERLGQLSRRIAGLKQDLQTRHDIRTRGIGEIDYQISQAAWSLKEFEFWGIGYNRGVDMKRGLLERQLADLRHKRRQEEHSFWRDAVALRRELRDVIAEYQGTLQRMRLMEEPR